MSEDLSKHAANLRADSPIALRKAKPHSRKARAGGSEKPSRTTDRMLACRYELKYQIGESKAEAIAQFIKPYLRLDHYCKLQPSGAYPVVTLYLDSHDMQLCRQTLEGKKNRFKLRVRSYTDKPDYPRFFEIKRRMNTIVIKSRARVMYPDMASLLSGWSLPPQDYRTDRETLGQFQLYMKSLNARPVMRVRYLRRAYEGDSENRVRVTFDRELAYKAGSSPEVIFDDKGWQRHGSKAVILEIKFTERYPIWLNRMVKYFNLRQQSLSKYVTSVKDSCFMGFCAPRVSV
jgi:hypothetical protein